MYTNPIKIFVKNEKKIESLKKLSQTTANIYE